ncbi:MAG: hypothetical protein WC501_04020 [Candidatus Micrarchaeia archaeon]
MIGIPAKEKKEVEKKPMIDSFKVGGKVNTSLKELAEKLSTVSFLEVALETDAVSCAYIESRDISNSPYLFSLIKIKKEEMSVIYSIPPTIAPKKRRMDVIRQFLNILNIINEDYSVDMRVINNLIEKSLKDIEELIDKKTAELYVEYDTLKNENAIISKKQSILEKEVEELKVKNYELREKNERYLLKIKKYENPSDETLRIKIIEWIKDHKGEISIPDFVSVYFKDNESGEQRVEEILDELVKEGYLQGI